ncbi:hypothetical protein ACG3SL_21130 (plasmid) [Sphingomonas sp. CJ20]
MKITASLVLYCNAPDVFEQAIRSVVESDADTLLSVIDNSPAPLASAWFSHPRVRYRHAGANIGFGAGHNLAFAAVAETSDVHFIVNPDVAFDRGVIATLADVFRCEPAVTAAMPAIQDEQGIPQPLCKALPTPVHLIVRRFVPFRAIRNAIDATYVLAPLPAEGLIDIPNLSGCFLAVRSATMARIGGFDERYFMYMEDIDLVRRLGDHGRTVFVPGATVVHGHARTSYQFGKLMLVHVRSALRYFGKWGWIRDPVRASRNDAARRRIAEN